MSALEKPVYRFGAFELDPDERRLLAEGVSVTLTPKVFDTLVLLVERAGHAVSKDDLMAALWPRGFVHESNLTKHIWLIRKALGDSEDRAACIQTLPKYGYRFVAPVRRIDRDDAHESARSGGPSSVEGGSDSAPSEAWPVRSVRATISNASEDAAPAQLPVSPGPADMESSPTLQRPVQSAAGDSRRWRLPALIAATVVLAVTGWLRFHVEQAAGPVPGARGTALAIVDFNNLAQNPKDAWLGPALTEMLATEASLDGDLHAVPGELVRPARADLEPPLTGGYSPLSLATLRKRLATDYVLSGSYLVSGSGDEATLRIDLALQDARDGRTVATVSRTGSLVDLPGLVTAAGGVLRERLGARTPSAGDLQAAQYAEPPTAEVARRIGFALDALHRYDPARARDELVDAVAQFPSYAPAYSYLAQAWSALGYQGKALAAARQAASNAGRLPVLQRLQIEAQLHEAEFDWPAAVITTRALVAQAPGNPEYRLQLVDALLAAGKAEEAAEALVALRGVAAADDARVELAAARVATAHDDPGASRGHAARALALARARDQTGLIADATVQLSLRWTPQTMAASEASLRDALVAYQRIDNPHGEAYARQNLANLLWEAGKAQPAREEYQRAMATYQRIGDKSGVAAIYSNLCRMLWTAGDRDAAATAARHALDLRVETGDLRGQAWNITALATIRADDAVGDDVVALYRQAIRLDEAAGDRGHRVFVLSMLTDALRTRGELAEAARTCEEARAGAHALADESIENEALFQCAQITLADGNVEGARAQFADAEQRAINASDNLMPPNVEMALGAIDLGRRDFSSARAHLLRSIEGWVKADVATGEAVAQSQLALCEMAIGDVPARDRAVARATDLRKGINERGEMLTVDIALAQVRGRNGTRDEAMADLRTLASDARTRDWVSASLEAQLAEYDVLLAAHDEPASRRLAAEITTLASGHGFRWILARLETERSAQAPSPAGAVSAR